MSVFTDPLPPRPTDEPVAPSRRAVAVDAVAVLLLAVVCGVLASTSPVGQVDELAVIAGVALYAIAWQVSFTVGAGTSTTLSLVFVPMWFAVSPAFLPVVAAAGQLCAWLIASRLGGRAPRARDGFAHVADAWHAVGPAVVIAVAGLPGPSMALLPLLLIGAVAQLAVHVAVVAIRRRAAGRPAISMPPRRLVGDAAVDLSLAPLGLLLAVVLQDALWPMALVLPLMAALAKLSRERDGRISDAHRLADAYRGTAALMADVLEADDEYTGGEHTEGVVVMAGDVGRALGLAPTRMQHLELGALLHDIGKLRVPNEIINKPGKLTAQEWEVIEQHPAHGEVMLRRVGGLLAEVAPIVRGHHERFDGGGYPDGLVGEAIPLEARIITVCDSFSAMTTDRSYRRAMSHDEAIAELHRCTPGQFDPVVVEALERSLVGHPDAGLRVAAPAHPPYGAVGSVAAPEVPAQREFTRVAACTVLAGAQTQAA